MHIVRPWFMTCWFRTSRVRLSCLLAALPVTLTPTKFWEPMLYINSEAVTDAVHLTYFILGSYIEFRMLLSHSFLRLGFWFKLVSYSWPYFGCCFYWRGGEQGSSACSATDSSLASVQWLSPSLFISQVCLTLLEETSNFRLFRMI